MNGGSFYGGQNNNDNSRTPSTRRYHKNSLFESSGTLTDIAGSLPYEDAQKLHRIKYDDRTW